jgi:hypothetical protein
MLRMNSMTQVECGTSLKAAYGHVACERSLAVGITEYVSKPVKLKDLGAIIKRTLGL